MTVCTVNWPVIGLLCLSIGISWLGHIAFVKNCGLSRIAFGCGVK